VYVNFFFFLNFFRIAYYPMTFICELDPYAHEPRWICYAKAFRIRYHDYYIETYRQTPPKTVPRRVAGGSKIWWWWYTSKIDLLCCCKWCMSSLCRSKTDESGRFTCARPYIAATAALNVCCSTARVARA